MFVFALSTTSTTTTTTTIFFQSMTLYFHYLKRRRQINARTSVSLSIRSFYVPYGLEDTPHNEKPTKSGITLRISLWPWQPSRRITSSTGVGRSSSINRGWWGSNCHVDVQPAWLGLRQPAYLLAACLPTLNCHACMMLFDEIDITHVVC